MYENNLRQKGVFSQSASSRLSLEWQQHQHYSQQQHPMFIDI
jgi:hypothetical protein